jgi:hypothetical protein
MSFNAWYNVCSFPRGIGFFQPRRPALPDIVHPNEQYQGGKKPTPPAFRREVTNAMIINNKSGGKLWQKLHL